eukprot:366444-Chlamydomonas_euryale.AAC.36
MRSSGWHAVRDSAAFFASAASRVTFSRVSAAKLLRQSPSHTATVSSSGRASSVRHAIMRARESSSSGLGRLGASPRRSIDTIVSIACALVACAAAAGTPSLARRSASLVSVPAMTPPRKKSLPSSRARRLGALLAADADASGASTTAVCVAYVPSASTAGRARAGAGAATAEP